MGILAGATVIGFEPLLENRKLIDDRLPVRLSEYADFPMKAHSFLPIEPGEAATWRRCQNGLGREMAENLNRSFRIIFEAKPRSSEVALLLEPRYHASTGNRCSKEAGRCAVDAEHPVQPSPH